MTTDIVDPAAGALRLPGSPHDPHVRAAAALLHTLAAAFPAAGLGIAGSAAAGTHRAGDGLEVVVVDPAFRRAAEFATESVGIRTTVVCLHPGFDGDGDERITDLVRSSFIARDPASALGEMQQTVTQMDAGMR